MTKLYRHYRNKEIYEIINNCEMQLNDEWLDAVIYKNIKFDNLYVRSKVEFFNKFIAIEESLYEVTLESKDKNIYECYIESDNIENASKKALRIINELGWQQYQYKVIDVKKIDKNMV